MLLVKEDDPEAAIDLATRALALYVDDRPGQLTLRLRVLESLKQLDDWPSYESHAHTLAGQFPDEPVAKWAVVYALAKRNRKRKAWERLQSYGPLEPTDDFTAALKIELQMQFDPTSAALNDALDYAALYPQSELVTTAAVQMAMKGPGGDSLPQETIDRSQSLYETFRKQFPEAITAIPINLDNPLDQLREFLQPQAERIESLLEQVRSGTLPGGSTTKAHRRPYATYITHRGAGVFCAVPADAAERQRDLADAQKAIGNKAVIDTSALAVPANLTGELWSPNHFTQLLIPDVLVDDAHAGVDDAATASATSMTWNITADRPELHEATEADLDTAQQRSERLVALIADHCTSTPTHQTQPLPSIDATELGHWISPIRVARYQSLPLYADDLALRRLARRLGLATFDTYALIEALQATSTITTEIAEQRRRDLQRAYVVDLPFSEERLTVIAAENEYQLGPATAAISRPAAWADPQRCLKFLTTVVRHLGDTGIAGRTPIWLYSASIGAALAAPPQERVGMLGLLLASAIIGTGCRGRHCGACRCEPRSRPRAAPR